MTVSEKCPECGHYNNRGTTVDAVIISDNRILLIKRGRDPFKNYWALPGGYIDWNETAEEAVAREVKEEVGLTVLSTQLIGVYSSPDRHPQQAINIAFSVTVSGEAKAGDDAREFKWIPIDELPEELAFDHKKIIHESFSKS
jgi:mutator protein MutT